MEVTESASPPARSPRRSSRRVQMWIGFGLIAVGLGAVLLQGLGEATLYFRTVDEAKADADDIQGDRFRLMGTVVPGTVDEVIDGVAFEIEHNNEMLLVRHEGDPPELFRPGLQVVLEGTLVGSSRFESDHIMVRHSSEYRAENPERVDPDEQ